MNGMIEPGYYETDALMVRGASFHPFHRGLTRVEPRVSASPLVEDWDGLEGHGGHPQF
jgi:hypothetical protein